VTVFVDTSALYALLDRDEKEHAAAVRASSDDSA
jgi:predicted nucleic acid-binding protein